MKLLGIKINHDYNAETRVFANLLRHREDAYEATVLYNCWQGSSQGVEAFERDACAPAQRVDTGWRPNGDGRRTPFGKVLSVARFYASLPSLLKFAKRLNLDVIYSCQQKWDLTLGSFLARRLNKPQIVHLHYTIGPWLGKEALERIKTCDHVVTVSDFIRDLVLDYGVAPEKVTTVRNAMRPFDAPAPGTREAIRTELGIPQDAPVLGMVARLDHFKGAEDTIEAFARIAPDFPEARLVMVGDGCLRKDLQKQAMETGVSDRILFTGRRSDVPNLLAAFDVFSHPSRKDPAPLAILEACAAGLPVVAYAEGGVCEFIQPGKTGLLAPSDDVAALAENFARLLGNLPEARVMGQRNRQRIDREFRPEDAGRQMTEVLQKVVDKHQRRTKPTGSRAGSHVSASSL